VPPALPGERPAPPAELDAVEVGIWRAIVGALPPTWMDAAAHQILTRAVAQAAVCERQEAQLRDAACPGPAGRRRDRYSRRPARCCQQESGELDGRAAGNPACPCGSARGVAAAGAGAEGAALGGYRGGVGWLSGGLHNMCSVAAIATLRRQVGAD
jgi:hypothetical protein